MIECPHRMGLVVKQHIKVGAFGGAKPFVSSARKRKGRLESSNPYRGLTHNDLRTSQKAPPVLKLPSLSSNLSHMNLLDMYPNTSTFSFSLAYHN